MASTNNEIPAAEKPLYKGSCHCGFITYTVRLDLVNPNLATNFVLTKCNCSICHKTGYVAARPTPLSSLTIVSPEGGRDALIDYTFGTCKVHHLFCPKCGIRCFLEGSYSYKGEEVQVKTVNVLTLDGKADGSPMEDLRQIKIGYGNNKSPGDGMPTAKEPWEGGIW